MTKVILTHCHSDHDSGVVQMILEGLLSLSLSLTNAHDHTHTIARTRSHALFALIRECCPCLCSPGEKIELYTTRTVNESYKRKVNAITGLADVGEYYTFRSSPLTCRTTGSLNLRVRVLVVCEKCRPVLIGDKVNIHGAEFEFDYSFHTVPTVRFKLSFLGKSISYSSDTYYNPQVNIFAIYFDFDFDYSNNYSLICLFNCF